MNNKLNNNKIIFQIIPNTGINDHFDYLIIPNQQLNIGNIVIIPFGNKKIKGTIINQVTNSNFTKLKAIDSHIQPFKIPDKTLNFLDFFSKYNLIKRGIAYKMLTQYADQLSTNIALISLSL